MKTKTAAHGRGRPMPPGRIKITNALITLLAAKKFNAITTAEIARRSGITEALIYKYFKDKRDLLHQILSDYLKQYDAEVKHGLKGIKGAGNKLRKLIWVHVDTYANNRVFVRIRQHAFAQPLNISKQAETAPIPQFELNIKAGRWVCRQPYCHSARRTPIVPTRSSTISGSCRPRDYTIRPVGFFIF